MMFDVTRFGATHSNVREVSVEIPHYTLCLEDIDELVAEIFKVARQNPDAYLKTMMVKPDAQTYLQRDNRFR
jgi:hypothetical protein